jgi:hypothetical protein
LNGVISASTFDEDFAFCVAAPSVLETANHSITHIQNDAGVDGSRLEV